MLRNDIKYGDRLPECLIDRLNEIPAKMGIYFFRCVPTDTYYVGFSKNMRYRLKQHIGNLERQTYSGTAKQDDYNTYGPENYEIGVLDDGYDYIQEEEWTERLAKEHHVYNQKLGTQGNHASRQVHTTEIGRLSHTYSNKYRAILRKYNDKDITTMTKEEAIHLLEYFRLYEKYSKGAKKHGR